MISYKIWVISWLFDRKDHRRFRQFRCFAFVLYVSFHLFNFFPYIHYIHAWLFYITIQLAKFKMCYNPLRKTHQIVGSWVYDTKMHLMRSCECKVRLECHYLLGLLREVVLGRVTIMSQRNRFKNHLYFIGPYAEKDTF